MKNSQALIAATAKKSHRVFTPVAFEGAWLLSQANLELEAYLSKANTDCADWLACANIAVAACVIICALAKLVLSLA